MPFREKLAWLSLLTMLVAYAVYFGLVGPRVGFGQRRMIDILWTFGAVALTQVLVVIIAAIALALVTRPDARAPADERDRAIARRGAAIGYYVLLFGAGLVGVVMPFTSPPWKIVNTALAAIVLAEAARQVVVLLSYRRGWHG